MTIKPRKPRSKKGPAKKQDEVSTSRPVDTIANRVKTLRSAASALEHGRHASARKKLAIIASDSFTRRQTDTIIAALRLWQRAPQYPEVALAEEHGRMLSDAEIDRLIENQINTPVEIPESVKEARSGLIPSDETDALLPLPEQTPSPLEMTDKELDVLDTALNTAEDILKILFKTYSAAVIKQAFAQHVSIHLGVELANIEAHGHRNDDPEDEDEPTIYSELVELAELVAAANTEFEGLESGAKNVLDRITKLRID